MKAFPFRRIIVVGATSSGKSTLAEALTHRLGAEFIELGALHWESGWREAPPSVFRERVQETVAAQVWVIVGNYRAVRDNLAVCRSHLVARLSSLDNFLPSALAHPAPLVDAGITLGHQLEELLGTFQALLGRIPLSPQDVQAWLDGLLME